MNENWHRSDIQRPECCKIWPSWKQIYCCPCRKKPTITVFLYRSHHIECLIKELCIDNSLVNPKYTLMIFSKEKFRAIIVLYCIPLEFHQKMTNWVFLNSLPFIQLLSTLNWKTLKELVQLCFVKQYQRRYKYLVIGTHLIFKRNALYSILRNGHHSNAPVIDWQHIWYVWWTWFSKGSRHSYDHKLCLCSRQLMKTKT